MDFCERVLRRMVLFSAGIAGVGLLTMMLVTCADVILRHPGKALLKP